ncbi:hypothetical protein T440DRAFT_482971 [Plenodomus tracheiphilus IPT5]|uniref:Uncharacterized protein n=1 Tax=Plenodomus tracheiphilus IPT5 TaxID=1408161 RepID=A0A6A7ARR8_9PLEO|nr:hypothetical protein T440DRAFT_482971 [Plenodomus tracheiphilus IPT5]
MWAGTGGAGLSGALSTMSFNGKQFPGLSAHSGTWSVTQVISRSTTYYRSIICPAYCMWVARQIEMAVLRLCVVCHGLVLPHNFFADAIRARGLSGAGPIRSSTTVDLAALHHQRMSCPSPGGLTLWRYRTIRVVAFSGNGAYDSPNGERTADEPDIIADTLSSICLLFFFPIFCYMIRWNVRDDEAAHHRARNPPLWSITDSGTRDD